MHDVLDHDEGAVHDDAEVERAETEQVRGNAAEVHADEGKQQRERNGDGRQQRRTDAAEKNEQHGDHDDEAFEQRVLHRVECVVHEVGAVVDGDDLHALRQPIRVELVDGFVDAPEHLARVFAPPHEDDAFHTVELVAEREDAGAWRGADAHGRHIPDEDRHTARRRQEDALQIADRLNEPDPADDQTLLLVVEERTARVLVVGVDRPGDFANREVVSGERCGVDLDLILLDGAAKWRHVGHARDLQHPRLDNPILNLSQPRGVHAGALEGVPVQLADRRGHRSEGRLHTIGQDRVSQLFEDHLPREVVVGSVLERQLDDRQAKDGAGAPGDHVRDAVERPLDRHRHLLLDFLSRVSRVDGDDNNLRVRDVRVGFDAELGEGPDSHDHQREPEDYRQEALVHRQTEQLRDHEVTPVSPGPAAACRRPPRPCRPVRGLV